MSSVTARTARARARRSDARTARVVPVALTVAVGGGTFWLAYDNGAYGLVSRTSAGLVLWWTIAVGLVAGLWPRARVGRPALLAGILLALFAAWTAASIDWAPSAEKTFEEFDRVSLFVAVFVLVAVAAPRATTGRWADGLALAIPAVGMLALATRVVPEAFPGSAVDEALGIRRLAYPLNYWNGLATLAAFGVPLLLRAAVVWRSSALRGLALAPMPLLGAVIFLASSRVGTATALIAAATFLAFTGERWAAAGAAALAGLATAASVALLDRQTEFVNAVHPSGAALADGRRTIALIVLVGLASGALYAVGIRFLEGRVRAPAWAGWVLAGTAVAVVAAVVAVADPVDRARAFAEPAPASAIPAANGVRAHLVSSSGYGRWQLWQSAVDAFREHPDTGIGAGSFEAWWAEHGTLSMFVRDAHSLYVETLGELGAVGLALLAGALLTGLVTAVARARRRVGRERATVAALGAVLVGWCFAAAFDWVWELTVLSIVAVMCLALLTGPATERDEPAPPPGLRTWQRVAIGAACLLLAAAQAVPLLAAVELDESRQAAGRNDTAEASSAALAARDVQPWAASPYLQLALVAEQRGDVDAARTWIGDAIERDRADWRLWLVRARLETRAGSIRTARAALHEAVRLNPRSPIFRNSDTGG
jgi:hypothetical protein